MKEAVPIEASAPMRTLRPTMGWFIDEDFRTGSLLQTNQLSLGQSQCGLPQHQILQTTMGIRDRGRACTYLLNHLPS